MLSIGGPQTSVFNTLIPCWPTISHVAYSTLLLAWSPLMTPVDYQHVISLQTVSK